MIKKKVNKTKKEETLDERLSKVKADLTYKGKKVEWKDIKNKSWREVFRSPFYHGSIPKIWQENMKEKE